MANNALLDNLQLFFNTSARLLICTRESCKFALSNGPSRITTHLHNKHSISTEARKGLNRLLKSLSPAPLEPDNTSPRADRSAKHDKLQVYKGFACINCQFRTINIQSMRCYQSNPPDDCCDSRASKGRREVLAALTRTFTSPGGREYYIGHGQQCGLDEDLVSLGEDEDRIACLVRLVDVMINRSGRGDCSQSANGDVGDNNEEEEEEEEDSEEDDMGEEEEEDNAEDHSEEGKGGANQQEEDRGFTTWLKDLGEITDDDEYDIEVEAGAGPGSPEELVELLFGLTLALATQPVVNGQPQTTVLVYFSGILGFSSSPGGSAFLPARHIPLLKLNDDRDLRNYGQVIARTDTPPHLLRWSDNGQVVSLGDEISVSMSQFRRLPKHFIKEAAMLCNEMMFAWDPAIDLANITDDMTNNKEGFSFVLYPRNKLDTAYLELVHRASTAHRNGLFRGNG
ncbi:uncharacterized protein BKA55DRAFT_545827 [Fusarium redolens]|uniref:Uncharacterized protein n=1 Tax=Fusarium redolens TaxID=48865 RepID=A0A9P9JLR8_FUSRE|nr:uncharacterized protein BKA55DRAFT_545827 [Fusarium redolens]KAH7227215.1 hypothetical protein BKA55DRAFT_545827 [Fusarium redolens]